MRTNPTLSTLDRAHSLHLQGAHRVTAQRGTLWVTCDGEPDDWVLEEGSSVLLDGSRPVLVTALGDQAQVLATPLAPPPLLQRVQRWWQGARAGHSPLAEVPA